jgi:hypothetical protein
LPVRWWRAGPRFARLVREGTSPEKIAAVTRTGAQVVPVDFADPEALTRACAGAVCVVSALSGLHDVIVRADVSARRARRRRRAALHPVRLLAGLHGAAARLEPQLRLRRAFRERLDRAPIRAHVRVQRGFADMLNGPMPLIVRPIRRVLYWDSADVTFPLTTEDDTAAVTAAAALDPDAPRSLHVAGGEVSSRDLARIMSEITRKTYKPFAPAR